MLYFFGQAQSARPSPVVLKEENPNQAYHEQGTGGLVGAMSYIEKYMVGNQKVTRTA